MQRAPVQGAASARYDAVVAQARSADELVDGFLDALGRTLHDEAHLHRLWYDIRAQALFDASFQADIAEMINESLEDVVGAGAHGAPVRARPHSADGLILGGVAYAIMDGLFQQALLKYLSGQTDAVPNMQADVRAVLRHIAGV